MAEKAESARQNGKKGGRPKGSKNKTTQLTQTALDKAVLREEARRIIAPQLERLLAAQIANATGIKYLVTRHKNSGKFIRVTEAMARMKGKKKSEGEDEETIEVWEKDPNVQAFTDLLNRLIDKPAEQFNLKADVKHRHTLEDLIVGSRAEPA